MKTLFKLGETIYKSNDEYTYFYKSTGGFDKKGNPLMVRIGRPIWEKAWDEYMAQDGNDEINDETEEDIKEKVKIKKPRKSKDIAFDFHGRTLTAKQVDFLKEMAETSFFEHGENSSLWCDVLADEIGGQFAGKPMTVGAMISTLKEKDVITVGKERVNGHMAKYFAFTPIGKEMLKELGIA